LRFGKEDQMRREALRSELKEQHKKDLNALEKKIERERKEKSLQRESDTARYVILKIIIYLILKRLEQRFRNLLRDQRNEQRAQTNLFDKELNSTRGRGFL
jgi:hypothetical protein